MAHYKVILAYDGTNFRGYQRQTQERTVQGVVESALREIGWQDKSLLAAGRTDTGVHASGQVIAFDLNWAHSHEDLLLALNANLPYDVAVFSVSNVDPGFHPRYDALGRCYRYRIYSDSTRNPLKDRFLWRVCPEADLDRMKEAAGKLVGIHDFAAFGTPQKKGGSTIRNVSYADWEIHDEEIVFKIQANAFLYHMVRRLVSFQVQIGQGKYNPRSVPEMLESGSASMIQGLAPPQGLVLSEVIYPDTIVGDSSKDNSSVP